MFDSGYPFLATARADDGTIVRKLEALRTLGHPYTDEEIAQAPQELAGKSELDALIAYLQGLGTSVGGVK